MSEEKSYQKLLNKVASYCSKRECSAEEIRKKLTFLEPETTEKMIIFLVENNFLNEERYAFAYARDKFRFNRWGKRKIAAMLSGAKISSEIIKAALAALPKSEYDNVLKKLLTEKFKTLGKKTKDAQKAALFRFGVSKGFEPALVQTFTKEICREKWAKNER
jgi:regulatory protein